eukprot:5049661-Lingulodinium_polyedra.AAC.1
MAERRGARAPREQRAGPGEPRRERADVLGALGGDPPLALAAARSHQPAGGGYSAELAARPLRARSARPRGGLHRLA